MKEIKLKRRSTEERLTSLMARITILEIAIGQQTKRIETLEADNEITYKVCKALATKLKDIYELSSLKGD